MTKGAALTVVNLTYIRRNIAEFHHCQEQIRGKWIPILIMKLTKIAKDLLPNLKEGCIRAK